MQFSDEIRYAINDMFLCRNMLEHMRCYQQHIDILRDWTFVVFSEDEGQKIPSALCTNYDEEFAIINLGCADRYYAVNQHICREMLKTGESNYFVDMCIQLDTQAVSYLKNIFEDYNKRPNCDQIKTFVDYLQLPGVNYCCLPYIIENAAKKDSISKIECYKNIRSFNLFKAFNYKKMLENAGCVYDKGEGDIQIDTDSLYNSIFSETFGQYCEYYFGFHRVIYLLLLKTICIEFKNSKKSANNKMMELVEFVNDKLGGIAERELEICYHYFEHDERTRKFFKRVQRNSKNLLDSINGMAWDLVHVRLVEREYMTILTDKVSYAIHMLLTFDNGLKEILQINPVEQIALCDGTAIPKLKNRWMDGIGEAKEKMISEESRRKREVTFQNVNYDKLQMELEHELMQLCT